MLPFSPRNIDSLHERYENDPRSFEALKEPGDLFAFKIYGNHSLATFENMKLLLEYLDRYSIVHERDDVWDSLQFYRVAPGSWKPTKRERAATIQDRRSRTRTRGALMGPTLYKAKEAERKRLMRASDSAASQRERERDRLRKAAKRAANPEWNKAERLKENIKKRNRRKQTEADKRNGYSS